MRNGMAITEFIILGFPGIQGVQIPLFTVIFFIYITTLAGNGLTIAMSEPRLQIPVYFFLCHLSFLETWYTTTVIPKLLESFVVAKNSYLHRLIPLLPGLHWVIHPHCHVLWPWLSHLPAPSLSHNHDQQPLSETGLQLLSGGLHHCVLSDDAAHPVAILWQLCHRLCLLWCWPYLENNLCRHKHFGVPGSLGNHTGDPRVTLLHYDFLCLYPVYHLTDSFSYWPPEGFLYLCLSSDSCLPVPWSYFAHVHETHSTLLL